MQHTIDNWTGGPVRFFLSWLISSLCEASDFDCFPKVRVSEGHALEHSHRQTDSASAKEKPKKTTISNPTPKLKNKTNHHKVSASYTWTWIAATSPTTAGPLKLCSGFKISDFFLNIKLGNLESYSTWKPDTLLRAVEDLKRQQQLQAVVQQDFGRTESYQVGGNKFIFLILPWLIFLIRRAWPPLSSPSWTARQPARPSWPRPSAEMLTPSALSLNDKWEAFDDDSRWC